MYIILERGTNHIEGWSYEYPSENLRRTKNFIEETIVPLDWEQNWNKGKYVVNIISKRVEAVAGWTPPIS
jgi:hypothetical protein